MTMTQRRHRDALTIPASPASEGSFASVYVGMAANLEEVRSAVAKLALPKGVTKVVIAHRSMTYTFGCRIAVDLTGTFDEVAEGKAIARSYARRLSALLNVPAFALYDLLRCDWTRFLC